jgi:hypothetical protein
MKVLQLGAISVANGMEYHLRYYPPYPGFLRPPDLQTHPPSEKLPASPLMFVNEGLKRHESSPAGIVSHRKSSPGLTIYACFQTEDLLVADRAFHRGGQSYHPMFKSCLSRRNSTTAVGRGRDIERLTSRAPESLVCWRPQLILSAHNTLPPTGNL